MSVLLIRYSEIGIKSRSRQYLIGLLASNIRRSLKPFLVQLHVEFDQIRIDFEGQREQVLELLKSISGIAYILPVFVLPRELDVLCQFVCEKLTSLAKQKSINSFCIESRRKDKFFHLTSPEIEAKVGHAVQKQFPDLQVKLKQADLIIYLDIQQQHIFVYFEKIKGLGGLPVKLPHPTKSADQPC